MPEDKEAIEYIARMAVYGYRDTLRARVEALAAEESRHLAPDVDRYDHQCLGRASAYGLVLFLIDQIEGKET